MLPSIMAFVSVVGATYQTLQLNKEAKDENINNETSKSIEYQRFGEALFYGLKLSSINDVNDIRNIYIGSGISKLNKENYDITNLLRIFIVDLYTGRYKAEEKDINTLMNKIKELIHKFEESLPYENLPHIERSILTDITSFLDSDNKESVKRKVDELAGILKTREEHLNKLEKSNKNSNKVAVIGIVLTIVFGFLPFIMSWIPKWLSS